MAVRHRPYNYFPKPEPFDRSSALRSNCTDPVKDGAHGVTRPTSLACRYAGRSFTQRVKAAALAFIRVHRCPSVASQLQLPFQGSSFAVVVLVVLGAGVVAWMR